MARSCENFLWFFQPKYGKPLSLRGGGGGCSQSTYCAFLHNQFVHFIRRCSMLNSCGFSAWSDIDECTSSNHNCVLPSQGGVCTNTAGSYKCSCAPGYTGNGVVERGFGCAGKDEMSALSCTLISLLWCLLPPFFPSRPNWFSISPLLFCHLPFFLFWS